MSKDESEVKADGPAPVKEDAPKGKPLTAKIARALERAGVPHVVAEIRTAEQWAEAKGMFPEFVEVAAPFARADAPRTRQHNPQFWRFAATRAGSGWPIGKELTEAEFDAAVLAATTQTYR
jgi:hypothetical protein